MVDWLDESVTRPEEALTRHSEARTSAFVKSRSLGQGTLYIAENRLSWLSEDGRGFNLTYPSIALHAVSKDLDNFPHECLYLMVDTADECGDKSDSSEDESDTVEEVRFVPAESTSLQRMYKVLADCQTLHPDPGQSISEDDGEEDDEDEDSADEEFEVGAVVTSDPPLGLNTSGNGVHGEDEDNEEEVDYDHMDIEPGQFDDA